MNKSAKPNEGNTTKINNVLKWAYKINEKGNGIQDGI